MSQAILTSSALAAILLAAALVVVWSRRNTWLRAAAIPLAVAAMAGGSGIVLLTLGYAVPLIGGLTAPAGEAPMLSAKLVVHDGIYVTMDLPDGPRLYWLPWDADLADRIQEMLSDPNGAGVVMTVPPFEFSWDINPPDFQPLPQPKVLPDKPVEAGPTPPHVAA